MKKKRKQEPIVEVLAISVPAERVWHALTTPSLLGDLIMGHVEMDWRPGRPFQWNWSVWAAAAPGRVQAGQFTWRGRILDSVPGSTLVLGGPGESTATLTLKGQAEASLVTVVQGETPGVDLERYRHDWADFLLKLKTLLEQPPAEDAIFVRTLMRATPQQVIQAWTNARAMSALLPGRAEVQARKNGQYVWLRKSGMEKGVFLEIVKGRRVAFTWEAGEAAGRAGRISEVRVNAEQTPYGVLVSLEQSGAAAVGRGLAVQRRAWAHLLERMRVFFHFGKKIRVS
jgi:uncharacterized protein YndB with AHSA1/START domain